jgi:hypothetical protein
MRNQEEGINDALNTTKRMAKRIPLISSEARWADQRNKGLTCRHTHQPVFMSYTHADKMREEIQFLELELEMKPNEDTKRKVQRLRELLMIVISAGGEPMKMLPPKPFYFNTGCCSFADDDIRGIELSDGEIRLVKETRTSREKKLLGKTELSKLMEY